MLLLCQARNHCDRWARRWRAPTSQPQNPVVVCTAVIAGWRFAPRERPERERAALREGLNRRQARLRPARADDPCRRLGRRVGQGPAGADPKRARGSYRPLPAPPMRAVTAPETSGRPTITTPRVNLLRQRPMRAPAETPPTLVRPGSKASRPGPWPGFWRTSSISGAQGAAQRWSSVSRWWCSGPDATPGDVLPGEIGGWDRAVWRRDRHFGGIVARTSWLWLRPTTDAGSVSLALWPNT